jgi:hypothetical protein
LKRTRRTEIVTYSRRLVRIGAAAATDPEAGLSRGWCASCGKQVTLISLDDAFMSGLSLEAVQRQVEAGRIHLIEKVGGSALICFNSLIQI